MKEDKYIQESNNLALAIDIGVECMKKYPPKIWNSETLIHVINSNLKMKDYALNPEPKYRNMTSLKYLVNDFFVYYQEGGGVDIEEFWKKIRENELPYKRENKLKRILKRKKINNDIEYNFVKDVIGPYEQEGLITLEEVYLLDKYIEGYENKNNRVK